MNIKPFYIKRFPPLTGFDDENMDDVALEIAHIRSGSLEERRFAVKQLSKAGLSVIPMVVSALCSADSDDERWYLALVLAKVHDPVYLINIMQENRDPVVRRYLSAALGEMGYDAVDPLVTLFRANDPELRGYASLALCRIGIPAIPALKSLLNDKDSVVSSCSMLTLMRMGETGIDTAVKEGIDSPD